VTDLPKEATLNPQIVVFKKMKCNGAFLNYLCQTPVIQCQVITSLNGSTIATISQEKIGSYIFALPPLAEQEAIAAYLDARCADIDKVVATQQKRIALLQELKQSEITQAVTRGLNPDARMKDSGVEWIGMVPEHWEVKKLKFVVSCNDDVLNDRTEDDQIIRYVEISDVNSIEGITNSTEYEFKKAPSRARRITKKDDVIVSTVRTYLKAIAKVKEDDLIVSTGFAVLRAKNINPSFLAYSTLSELFLGTVISESVGVSYPAINSSDIINIKLPVPPSDEQVEIAEYLDRRCGEIDKQIGAVTKQIELLREYKQALITEVVTGKRRV
jgi:type I restriction enzyme S subunit